MGKEVFNAPGITPQELWESDSKLQFVDYLTGKDRDLRDECTVEDAVIRQAEADVLEAELALAKDETRWIQF